MNMLKGKIISLRKVKQEDLEFFRDWRNEPVIWQNNTQFILLNLKHQDSWFNRINSTNAKEKMFTIINEKQNPIGICGLVQIDEDNRNAKVAIIIGNTKNHSKGIGTESLNLLLDLLSSQEDLFDKEDLRIGETFSLLSYTNFEFKVTDTILFGRESAGVPKKVHELVDNRLKIPLSFKKRSLNLSSSVAITIAESLRQNKLI